MKVSRRAELNKGFLIVLEDGTEFTVSEELYFTRYLYEKEEFNREEVEKLVFQDRVIEAEIICKKKLAAGLKPRSRLLAYLDENGFDADISNEALDNLERDGYLDDLKFATKILKRKMISSPMSKYAMEQWLLVNGLNPQTARTAIDKADLDDLVTARKIAERKFKGRKEPMKIAAYLASRGFEKDIIAEVTNMEEPWNT